MFLARRNQLAELAAKNRLPAIYAIKEHAEAGGLMAHAASRPEIFRRAAAFVDKNSDKNSERRQPCRTPSGTADENISTAKTLRLSVPPTLLARADEVIE